MTVTDWIPLIVTTLIGGGTLGGIYALLKLRPEAGQIVVTAAEGAVVVQTAVIKSLQEENRRLQERVSLLEVEREQDRRRIAQLERQLGALRTEVHEDKETS